MSINPLSNDLNYILEETKTLWDGLRNQSLFITGGTGFFGCWLLESFLWANNHLQLNANVMVLTRNATAFAKKYPHLANQSSVQFHQGDVRDFQFPKGTFSHIIHAATEASVQLNLNEPLLMLDTIVQGTKHTLEFARQCGAKQFLFASSGAVYGKQPPTISHLAESYPCQPDLMDPKSAYALGKGTAEHLCSLYARQSGIAIKIARCFAFVGPYLPLDIQYAIGNFIRDGLNGQPIIINSDGSSYRSYLYAADLAIWLWTLLFRGQTSHPYNVGSDEAVSIAELATLVANNFHPAPAVKIMQTAARTTPPERYVPDISRAKNELQLFPKISLKNAIQATVHWHLASLKDGKVVMQ